ncbi:hypothetical protein Tco_0601116 [Tanacetum coccineum]
MGLLKTNPGSTVKLDIEDVLGAKTYFKSYGAIYVDVAMKDRWTEGCRKVIGLDGCFLKGTIKGELLTMFPIAWVVMDKEYCDYQFRWIKGPSRSPSATLKHVFNEKMRLLSNLKVTPVIWAGNHLEDVEVRKSG